MTITVTQTSALDHHDDGRYREFYHPTAHEGGGSLVRRCHPRHAAESRLFRVFPGILAAKSPVFKDMLAFPQPENGETFDHCPLVRLSDSVDDVTFFLKAIFHYDFFEPWPVRGDFPILAAILRLSQKYQVEPLRRRALVHLSERCAPSLEKWAEFDAWKVQKIELVKLAREVSALWVLPPVFAACCWIDPDVLVSGLPAGVDGNTQTSILNTTDIVRCIRGATALSTTWTSKLFDFLSNPREIPGCVSRERCLAARWVRQQESELWRSDRVVVLNLWDANDWASLQENVCATCFQSMQASHAIPREEYWQALPGIFDLPEWSALLALKQAELNAE
ncbi:hypothetical protein C8R46DRAFT_1015497 [Mycena filopes]|nr:hypothetical protein C8R46DRAFT_1015497 [Mycena filopes]